MTVFEPSRGNSLCRLLVYGNIQILTFATDHESNVSALFATFVSEMTEMTLARVNRGSILLAIEPRHSHAIAIHRMRG